MPETDYLRVPADRVGALIGTKGETKQLIENATNTHLDIDSEECTVAIYPNENSSKAENIDYLMNENYVIWKEVYEDFYQTPLKYNTR